MTRLLQISAGLTLLGLALMVWSMIQPTPLPVILAMSVGQLLGTIAFGMFGYAVLVDQLRKQRIKGVAAAARRAARRAAAGSGAAGSAAPDSGAAGSGAAGSGAADSGAAGSGVAGSGAAGSTAVSSVVADSAAAGAAAVDPDGEASS